MYENTVLWFMCISVPWYWVWDHPDTVCNLLMNSECTGYQVQVSLQSVCFCWLPFSWWQYQFGHWVTVSSHAVWCLSICTSVLAYNYCAMVAWDFRTMQWMVYGKIFPAMFAVLYYKRLEQTDVHSWHSCWLQWFHLCVIPYRLIMVKYFALLHVCRWQLL